MRNKKQVSIIILSVLVLVAVLALIDNVPSKTANPALPRAVFYVS